MPPASALNLATVSPALSGVSYTRTSAYTSVLQVLTNPLRRNALPVTLRVNSAQGPPHIIV